MVAAPSRITSPARPAQLGPGSIHSGSSLQERALTLPLQRMKTSSLLLSLVLLSRAVSFAQVPVGSKSPPYVPPFAKPSAPAAESLKSNVQNVTPAEAEKLLAERKDIVVLDVRTADEFAAGHLPGAKNVDFLEADFAKRVGAYAGKPVIVHCAAGNRSAKAVPSLDPQKFPQVYHLDGGYKSWAAAGKPTITGGGSTK